LLKYTAGFLPVIAQASCIGMDYCHKLVFLLLTVRCAIVVLKVITESIIVGLFARRVRLVDFSFARRYSRLTFCLYIEFAEVQVYVLKVQFYVLVCRHLVELHLWKESCADAARLG